MGHELGWATWGRVGGPHAPSGPWGGGGKRTTEWARPKGREGAEASSFIYLLFLLISGI
jgi:hypothetical protein